MKTPSCLLVYGTSGNGKTYTSRILSKKGGILNVEMDMIINIITECVRAKFGESDPKLDLKAHSVPRVFKSENDFENFKNFTESLISDNLDFFNEFHQKLIVGKRPGVYRHTATDKSACVDWGKGGDFLESLAKEIINMIITYVVKDSNFFILEGYYFKEDSQYRKELLHHCKDIYYLECSYKEKKNSFIYNFNGDGLNDIIDVEQKFLKISKPRRSPYQIFSEKGVGDTQSYKKLEKLGIPSNLKGKSVIDLGCNEGFFSFECEKRGAKVMGVERDKTWYDLALERKEEFSSFVNFVNKDWNVLPTLNYKFDLVLFLAAFHYVKNNQLEILTNVCNALNDRGILILEIGLLDKNEGSFLIDNVKRPHGDICQFTNEFTIKKLLKDAGFQEIKIYGEGWTVRGDDLPRYVIHAIKNKNMTNSTSEINIELNSKFDNKNSSQSSIPNINEIETTLINFYNSNLLNRSLLKLGYKIMKHFSKK